MIEKIKIFYTTYLFYPHKLLRSIWWGVIPPILLSGLVAIGKWSGVGDLYPISWWLFCGVLFACTLDTLFFLKTYALECQIASSIRELEIEYKYRLLVFSLESALEVCKNKNSAAGGSLPKPPGSTLWKVNVDLIPTKLPYMLEGGWNKDE